MITMTLLALTGTIGFLTQASRPGSIRTGLRRAADTAKVAGELVAVLNVAVYAVLMIL